MTLQRKRHGSSRAGTTRVRRRRRSAQQAAGRKVLLEQLEDRRLLAVGPQLIGIQPNSGGLLVDGDTRNIAPRELTFRFDHGQAIDEATLDGIRITRLGDLFTDADDELIAPGYIGLGETPREVVLRFAETLTDDVYRIDVLGAGAGPILRNTEGVALGDTTDDNVDNGADFALQFKLDLGAQVVAVVPQPIERIGSVLTQHRDRIDVYFNDDDLLDNNTSAENPAFYQLILTADTLSNTDDTVFNPTGVDYDPAADRAILTFADDLAVLASGAGTFRLRIGTDEAPLSAPTVMTPADAASTFAGATDVTSDLAAHPSIIVSAEISPQPFPLEFPGAADEPGHRSIEHQSHLHQDADTSPDGSISRIAYNFREFYGVSPVSGFPLINLITENQKQRAREIFQIYGEYLGIDVIETPAAGFTIATGDLRAVDHFVPTGPGGVLGIASRGVAVMDFAESWDDRFGGDWFQTAMRQIGRLLGLGDSFELPPLTIQGSEAALGPVNFPGTSVEPDYPGDHDLVHGQHLYRPDATDIDMYRFDITATGWFSAEIAAERLANSSLLDSNLRLYRENVDGTRTLLSKNDDYFSEDSYIEADLVPGTYYIGVSSTGNEDYDPELPDSGFGGVSQGEYDLRLTFRADAANTIVDTTGQALDGDADGIPGGDYNFWFRTQTPENTIIVDKIAADGGSGSLAAPFNTISDAFIAAQIGGIARIVRIVGNGGGGEEGDGDLATLGDNRAYEIGIPQSGSLSLQDGSTMRVPRGVTVMIDAGAIFKTRRAAIDVGSSSPGIDRSQGALQVLGTPQHSVFFTSYHDESIGEDTFPLPTIPLPGDWGGIVYQNHLDRDEDRFDYERQGIFLNYVNHADIRFGGGELVRNNIPQTINPIHLTEARPTVSFNTITHSDSAAMSANPDSFEETNFHSPAAQAAQPFTADYDRVGPDIHGNHVFNNSVNGLVVRIVDAPGSGEKRLTVAGRIDDTDIVHLVADDLEVQGIPGGPIAEGVFPSLSLVTLTPAAGGTLAAGGTYNYILTLVDDEGNESMASAPTRDIRLPLIVQSLRLDNLPIAASPFVSRRLYRSDATGAGPYTLVVELDEATTTYIDDGTTLGGFHTPTFPSLRARQDARLAIDPGAVVKLTGSRFDVGMGAQFIAEGTEESPIIFTSALDDRYGAGGSFDTNNDGDQHSPAPGDWGGIYAGPTSSASIDHALVTFGGGVTQVGGSFAGFNALEIHQAEARVTHSIFEHNANGFGGQAPAHRFGFNPNAPGAIFVRASQPVISENILRDNGGSAININTNALSHVLVSDLGRETGPADRFAAALDNRGPLIRGNLLAGNDINGMQVRGEVLTTAGVWDDTDTVHVLLGQVVVPDYHTFGGLRLQSGFDESLVVKLEGDNTGFTATGRPLDIDDRIGGAVQIIGQPGRPVILTSLNDDTVGAGYRPDGQPQTDTNNDDAATAPQPGDWRSVRLEAFSHDRNVETIVELEPGSAGDADRNADADTAQFLGELAREEKQGDENRRLGFEVHGFINTPSDVDVYRFDGVGGTEVWLDIDRTASLLDTVVELIDLQDAILAQSDNSAAEQNGHLPLYTAPPVFQVNPLLKSGFQRLDHYTVNPRDAGMRVVLPGPPGQSNTYYVRVRSSNLDGTNPRTDLQDPNKLRDGRSAGAYQLQVRLRELDEVPGSTVRYADIRFATNGVELFGLPAHSPLLGEAAETTGDNDFPFSSGVQNLGALGASDRAAISVAGELADELFDPDSDFYRFTVNVDSVENIPGFSNPSLHVPVIIDLDNYDIGDLGRADTTISIFDAGGRLVLRATDSNIADDRPGPLQGDDIDDLSRGSPGARDAFIGPVELPAGDYFLGVHSIAHTPQQLDQFFNSDAVNPLVRLEPITSVERIAEDRIGASGGSNVAGASSLPVLFDESSPVPFHLGDVTLFVSRGRGFTGTNQSSVYTVDPFTGGFETVVGQFGQPNGDIAMRPDGELFTFSTGSQFVAPTDENTGNYLLIDTGTAAVSNEGDDGVITIHHDPATGNVHHNVGIAYQAIAYIGAAQNAGFVVGNRNAASAANRSAAGAFDPYDTNILYNFDITNGHFRGGEFAAPLHQAGTQAVNLGRILTATELRIFGAEVGDTFTIDIDGNLLNVTVNGETAGAPVDASTVVSLLVDAFNSSANPTFQNFQAFSRDDFLGNPGDVDDVLVIVLTDPAGASSTITPSASNGSDPLNSDLQEISGGGFGLGGLVTGMAFANVQAYVVDNAGGLYRVNIADNASTTFIADVGGLGIEFAGLAAGPDEVESNAYRNILFGVSSSGRLYAFDTSGELQNIFVDNQSSVQLFDEFGSPLSDVTGLDFGTLDRNLWHMTANRRFDLGHGIDATFENSRNNQPSADSSFYFGNERSGPVAGNKNNLGDPHVVHNVNFPGGAHGSIVSNEFDLSGYSAQDQPVLYFNYYLRTEGASFFNSGSPMRDAFRVFVAGDDGNWTLLGTNNSFRSPAFDEFDIGPRDGVCSAPARAMAGCVHELFDNSGSWRQARIPLGAYAGESNLRLRFDFSTAGSMNVGDSSTTGEELRAVPGEQLRDGQTFQVDGSQLFEFDLGYTLIAPSAGAIADGDTFTIEDVTYEFDLPAAPGVSGDNTPVQIDLSMTAAEVAQAVELLLAPLFTPPSFNGVLTNESNDTIATAEVSGLPGGPASYFATGAIGDNPQVTENAPDDVDLVEITVGGPSDILSIDIDSSELGSGLNPGLRLFDSAGNQIAFSSIDAAPTEPFSLDPYINISGLAAGTYYVGISAFANFFYDPNVFGTASSGFSTGEYELHIDVTQPGVGLGAPRVDNRVNLPEVSAGQLVLPPGSPLFVEGAPGVNNVGAEPMLVHAGMPRDHTGVVVRQALANVFSGGNLANIKQYKDLVRVIGHTVSDPGPLGLENSLAGDSFGAEQVTNGSLRGAANAGEGVYIDDVIIGFAERGEMVVMAQNNTNLSLTVSQIDLETLNLTGPYDVELRRGPDFGASQAGNPELALHRSFNTNDRLARQVSFVAPSAADIFDGQTFTLSNGLDTLSFEFRDANVNRAVTPGSVEIVFDPTAVDNAAGVVHQTRQADYVIARNIRDAINGPQSQSVLGIAASLADGATSGPGSTSNVINLFGGTVVGDHENGSDFFDFGDIPAVVGGRDEHDFAGDDNRFRDQGQVLIHSNRITSSAQFGIVADAAQRGSLLAPDAGPLPHIGPVRNTRVINDQRLAPGVVIENNLIVGGGAGGIRLAGEPVDPILGLAAVPVHRVVNNTIYGRGEQQQETQIDVVFAFDTSASMGAVINEFRTRLADFEQEMLNAGRDARYGLVTFPGSNPTPTQIQDLVDFTTFIDPNGPFLSFPLTGAVEDGSQAVRESLNDAVPSTTFSFRESARPVVILITDEDDDSFTEAPDAIAALQNNNALFFGIVSPLIGNTQATYGQFASTTGGALFDISDFNNNPETFVAGFASTLVSAIGGSDGIGIQIEDNVSPTILNNIFAGLDIGIQVDSTSQSTELVGAVFKDNLTNAAGFGLGNFPSPLSSTDPLFIDPIAGNFYLASGSAAIDSSIHSLGDRPDLQQLKSSLGLGESPILAPERDMAGQLRVDDTGAPSPPGLNAFVDRGALERSDFIGPGAVTINPRDNDTEGLDADGAVNMVGRPDGAFADFSIQLFGGADPSDPHYGIGVDALTVTHESAAIVRNDELLEHGVDYQLSYDAVRQVIRLTPLADAWPAGVYIISLANDEQLETGAPGSEPIAVSPITDLVENRLLPNQPDGGTRFTIVLGELDFGDAPDPLYPTTTASDGARHLLASSNPLFLGLGVDADPDGQPTPGADGDDNDGNDDDDGVTILDPLNAFIDTRIVVVSSGDGMLDAWIDLNQDGDWNDSGEQIISNQTLAFGPNPLTVRVPQTAAAGLTYARFRVSQAGGLLPTGIALDGEVEDYAVTITPNLPPTANDDSETTLGAQPVEIDVLANDNDPEGALDPSSVAIVSEPAHGDVVVSADGSITYTPDITFVGVDSFTYTVDDDMGLTSNLATVTVTTLINSTLHTNPNNPLDVNDDGIVAPDDVLNIINVILQNGGAIQLPNPPVSESTAPPPYRDPTGDGFVAPDDALLIINFLILPPPPAEGEGEGEDKPLLAPERNSQDLVGVMDFTSVYEPSANRFPTTDDRLDAELRHERRPNIAAPRLLSPSALLLDEVLPSISARRRGFQEWGLEEMLAEIAGDLAERQQTPLEQDLAVGRLWS